MRTLHRPHLVTTGLTWRELNESHAQELFDLITALEKVDNPPYRTSLAEVEEIFHSGFIGLGGWDGDSRLQAFTTIRLQEANQIQAVCSAGVALPWRNRGIGKAILKWSVAVAREEIAQRGQGGQIVIYTDSSVGNFEHNLEDAGFQVERQFIELRRPLTQAIEVLAPGQYLEVVPWREEFDEQVRRAHNKLMEITLGLPPQDPQVWASGRAFFAPEWSFVALDKSTDRAEVAGYLLSARYSQDWDALGWREGYTEILGVLPQWRQTLVAPALLTAALDAYQRDGMEYAAVGLANDNPTLVAELYRRLEYEPVGESKMWIIDLPDEGDLLPE